MSVRILVGDANAVVRGSFNVNLAQTRCRDLTARLFGDPDPRRFERSERLHSLFKTAEIDKPTAEERRQKILAAVAAKPLSAREISEAAGLSIDDVRADLQLMRALKLLERSGERVGSFSTVRWGLPGAEVEGQVTEFKPSFEVRLEAITALLAKTDSMSSREIWEVVGGSMSRVQATLKFGRERGVLASTGSSNFVRYSLARP